MSAAHLTTHGFMAAAFWLAVGAAIGGGFFSSLRWSVAMLTSGRAMLAVIAAQLARLVMIGIALTAIALYFGALPLLAASAGILLARAAVLRWGA